MKLTALLALLLNFSSLFSQRIVPRFETLNVDEGLSQSSVYAIYQDREGFIWIGTADGLNRYDGSEMKSFKVPGTEDVSLNNSNCIRGNLCEDKSGNIWFTNETGIYCFDRLNGIIRVEKSFNEPSYKGEFHLISIDAQDVLWLLNKSAGFVSSYSISGRKWTIYPYRYPSTVRHFLNFSDCSDDKGNIYFSLFAHYGIFKFDITNKAVTQLYPQLDITHVFFGKQKAYLVSPEKIYVYDSLSLRLDSMRFLVNKKPVTNFTHVIEDPFERLWILTVANGLLCYDLKQKKLSQLKADKSKLKSLSIDLLTKACIDRSNNLWIGTDGGGVCRIDLKPSLFNVFPLNSGDYPFLHDYFTKCFYHDDKGRIWFGTHNNGFNIFDPNEGTVQNFRHDENDGGSPGPVVGALFKDRDQNMWIGHSLGISIFDERRKKFISIPILPKPELSPSANFVFKFIQLQNGDLMACSARGLVRIKKNKENIYSGHCYMKDSLMPSKVTDVVECPNGDLWCAVPWFGIMRFGQNGDNLILEEKALTGVDPHSIHVDETNPQKLWVASSKGLILFDTRTKKFDLYNESNGIANSHVYGVLEDGHHNLWMSTNKGISVFNTDTKAFRNFSVQDGLQSNEFNGGAFYKDAAGTMYFGGIKGFNWFQPTSVTDIAAAPQVGIISAQANDEEIKRNTRYFSGSLIELPYDKNDLSFQFAVFDYTRPPANKIRYKLEGWDNRWTTTYGKNIRYSNLPPGSYTLRVRGSNGNDVWGQEKRLSICIAAPFWQTRWFYLAVAVLALFASVMITRMLSNRKIKEKLRALEKQRAIEAERNRISKDMHDEIGSGLTHIALMSDIINSRERSESEIKNGIQTIATSSRKLIQNMSDIVWTLNTENDTLENLLAYIREQSSTWLEPFDITYHIRFPDELPLIHLTNEQRRNLFLVTKEAISNAMKHAAATEIILSFEIVPHQFRFRIIDNGKGFNGKNKKINSNGLNNMKKRMTEIEGTVEIISEENKGTTILYCLCRK